MATIFSHYCRWYAIQCRVCYGWVDTLCGDHCRQVAALLGSTFWTSSSDGCQCIVLFRPTILGFVFGSVCCVSRVHCLLTQ